MSYKQEKTLSMLWDDDSQSELSFVLHRLAIIFCSCCPDDLTWLHTARALTPCHHSRGATCERESFPTCLTLLLSPAFTPSRIGPGLSAIGAAASSWEKVYSHPAGRNRLHPEIAAADSGAQLTSHYCTRVWSEPTGREADTFLISGRSGESLGNECKSHLSRPVEMCVSG